MIDKAAGKDLEEYKRRLQKIEDRFINDVFLARERYEDAQEQYYYEMLDAQIDRSRSISDLKQDFPHIDLWKPKNENDVVPDNVEEIILKDGTTIHIIEDASNGE